MENEMNVFVKFVYAIESNIWSSTFLLLDW